MSAFNVSESHPQIDVCLCTFRRASVARTICAIGAQANIACRLRLIVADNDETPSARALVETSAASAGLELCYVHAPARNISIARTACLEAATAPFIAFIDDDLAPTREWLSSLLAAASRTNADVILGPVRAYYPADAPDWVRRADLHSTFPTILPDGSIVTGYTCNALIRRETIGSLRFDPQLGRTGGEDTLFFHRLSKGGARFAYAENAIVDEPVDPQRISLRWLLKRSFRNGQTHAHVLRSNGEPAPVLLVKAFAKAGYCLLVSCLTLPSAAGWRRSLVRGALHLGTLSKVLGARDLELYGSARALGHDAARDHSP